VEAPLWSETLTSLEDIEFMAFPRVLGIAEIGWTRKPGGIGTGMHCAWRPRVRAWEPWECTSTLLRKLTGHRPHVPGTLQVPAHAYRIANCKDFAMLVV